MLGMSIDAPKTFGQLAFEAYDQHGENPGRDYQGQPTRPWNEMSQATREKWEEASQAVLRAAGSGMIGNPFPPPPPPPPTKEAPDTAAAITAKAKR